MSKFSLLCIDVLIKLKLPLNWCVFIVEYCAFVWQDVDSATAARIALEKQLENLEVEMEFLQRIHKQVLC